MTCKDIRLGAFLFHLFEDMEDVVLLKQVDGDDQQPWLRLRLELAGGTSLNRDR